MKESQSWIDEPITIKIRFVYLFISTYLHFELIIICIMIRVKHSGLMLLHSIACKFFVTDITFWWRHILKITRIKIKLNQNCVWKEVIFVRLDIRGVQIFDSLLHVEKFCHVTASCVTDWENHFDPLQNCPLKFIMW